MPQWDPTRLTRKIPFNLALCGGRRQGKSTALADLLQRNASKFGLVVAFVGSAACNPVLEELMDTHWDPRFFFSAWNDELVQRLLQQQEELKRKGLSRDVLIIIDDVILDGPARNSLENMAMRGRHFRISLACCAVSYVSLPKPVRRSLDCLLLFSCPMSGDLKVLTWEYARRSEMARFALDNLQRYECLVLETLERKQELFNWRANEVTLETLRMETEPPSPAAESGTKDGTGRTGGPDPGGPRPAPTCGPPDRTRSPDTGTDASRADGAGDPDGT